MESLNSWSNVYSKYSLSYPSEYLIRMLKGAYPKLNFDKSRYKEQSILDIGCGVGRNIVLFNSLGFRNVSGIEIDNAVVDQAKSMMQDLNITSDIRVGTNDNIPFDSENFDIVVSWNVCYYMGENLDFNKHISEYSRVLKPGGLFIFSVPKKSCFIYRDAEKYSDGYLTITNDPFEVRNGTVLKYFENEEDFKATFSNEFKDFVFGSINDDCFGLDYHWHIGYCYRK